MAARRDLAVQQPTAIQPPQAAQLASRRGSPFLPENIEQAWKLAQTLANSGLVPKALQGHPQDVLLVMMKGYELDLPPVAALSEIYVIEGKATCSARLLRALCLRRPDVCVRFEIIESTDKLCRVVVQRADGKPAEVRWMIEDAARAQLLGKDNWKKYPRQMLLARACMDAARQEFPDLISGLITEDEAEEIRERLAAEDAGPHAGFVAPPLPAAHAPMTATEVVARGPIPRDPPKEEVGSFAAEPDGTLFNEGCGDAWHDQDAGTGPASCPSCGESDEAAEEPGPATPVASEPAPPTDEEAIEGWLQLINAAPDKATLDDIGRRLAAQHPDGGVVRKTVGPAWANRMAHFRRGTTGRR